MAKNDTPEIPGLFDDLPEEAPQEQIAKISLRNWRTHLASIRTLDKRIEKLIDEAVKQALAQGRKLTSADIGRVFQRHPELRAALDKTMQQLNDDLTTTIEQGSKDAWLRANTAADAVVAAMANNNAQLAALLNAGTNKPQNDRALRAFQQREMQGLKLSDRVWRATEGMKLDMERAIEVALAEGVPAQKLSQRVRELLKEPHRLYRRVRDKDGNLRLSQAAQKYHPGTGVYRSSYKNAMRVARTEVNMAYQASDSERWTRSWWVNGIRVSLSNNHTSPDSKGRPAPLVDICDELAGDYPADFKFTGWHPQCRCYATAITCEYADIRDYYRRKRAGEDMTGYTPPGAITEPPEQFKQWLADNGDRLAGAAKRGTTPYFVANNAKYTDPNWRPSKATPAPEPKPKTPPYQKISLTEESYDELIDRFGAGSIKFIDHTTFNKSPMAGLNITELDADIVSVLAERGITIQHREYHATKASGLFEYTGNGIELERTFRMQNGVKTVEHSYFALDPKYQRKGLSKDLFKAMYRHYIGIGVERIEVHAALDRGGYTWARYGFMANDKQQALAAITPLRYASPPDGLKEKAQALIEDFYKTHADTEPFPIRVIAEIKGADQLMSGSNWYGHIDLTKDEQRQYFERYIGY